MNTKEEESDEESIYILERGSLNEVFDRCKKNENHKIVKKIQVFF